MKLNTRQIQWSRRYQAALGKHLKLEPGASLDSALELGRQAAAIHLETLDVARTHERTLLTLTIKDVPPEADIISRAKKFFIETIVPIEKTHLAARTNDRQVKTATTALRQRTAESTTATKRLVHGVAQRKVAEKMLKNSGQHLAKMLHESKLLQNRLRKQARDRLSTQENTRQNASRQLHDEIAQTLLAINLRLLTLKISAKSSSDRLKKEIAETQRLVKQSVRTIRRLAHEIDHYHEA